MTLFIAIVVGVLFAASIYLMLGRELKEICMGIFLLSHGANLAVIEAGRRRAGGLLAPVLGEGHSPDQLVDPLPQALVLTAIVIGFAVQGFLLTLLVVTWRRAGTLDTCDLATDEGDKEVTQAPAPSIHPSPVDAVGS